MENDFVAFILTHGRPDKVITYDTLKKCGYTGAVIILIDDEDKSIEQYKERFGDKVYVFSKEEIGKTFDQGDNRDNRKVIVYARNACFDIAKQLGYKYFIQLDDDYRVFSHTSNERGEYLTSRPRVKNLDGVFSAMLKFFKNTRIKTIAAAQGGDFIGGPSSSVFKKKLARKAMNSFICSTDRPFKFLGRINEDVTTYTREASTGNIFFTTSQIRLEQAPTQSSGGGMTETYLDGGTYLKSFYSVMFHPSGVKIGVMGHVEKRIHHKVKWKNTTPMILSERHKKKG